MIDRTSPVSGPEKFDEPALQVARAIVALPENWPYTRKKAAIQVLVAEAMEKAVAGLAPTPDLEPMWKAYEDFEFIRLKLVNHLREPERSAFWRAVQGRNAVGNFIAANSTASPDSSTVRTSILQAADKAAKVVEAWSDAKQDYAKRITGPDSSPDRTSK